jgi:hypothetical protein
MYTQLRRNCLITASYNVHDYSTIVAIMQYLSKAAFSPLLDVERVPGEGARVRHSDISPVLQEGCVGGG